MNPKRIETNALIVGAGPAGASTSIYLSKSGITHIIIDKASFPRDKICGDACSGKTSYVIKNANPDWMEEIHTKTDTFNPAGGLVFIAPNGKSVDMPFPTTAQGKPLGFTVPRIDLDLFLFEKLDNRFATIWQEAQILSIDKTEGMIEVLVQHGEDQYVICTRLIVGADGEKSIVRKSLSPAPPSPKASAVGLRAYYEGVTGLHEKGHIELHFLPELLPGYLWIFPLSNGRANVGVGMMSEDIRAKKINLREQMLHALETNPSISARFTNATLQGKIQGWGLPMSFKRDIVSGDHFILTGDAANLIDPFSGEGIGNALYSGMRAAEAILKALESDRYDAAFLKEVYDDKLYARIGGELKTSALLQRLRRYPSLLNFVVNKAHKSPALKETITGMFLDADLRKKWQQPSFYFNMLFNR